MKKLFFTLLLSLTLCLGAFSETDDRKIEVIPTVSASGNENGIAIDSELIIGTKFKLSNKLSLYGQLGAMYNVFETKFSEEWQLGFEPMVGIGTDNFRLSGFLNGLNIKAFDTGKMPFIEGGARLSLTPWKRFWISIFSTWPISDPVFVMPLKDTYLENDLGVYLITSEIWARQEHSYGADIDVGLGKKFLFNLDGYAINENNYQLGAGLQYQIFKNKPWVFGGNVFYSNFEDKDYFYAQNIFPQFLQDDRQGYSFKLGISNYGGLGNTDFNNQLLRITQPQYYSPVKKQLVRNSTKIGEVFKFDPCAWGGKCLDFSGSLCITQGMPPYKIFIDWGDGITEQYAVEKMGPFAINHHYLTAGARRILISGMDALHKTFSYIGKFLAEDCGQINDECKNVIMRFNADKDSVNPGKTVNFSWDVKGADEVTFNDKKIENSVSKYPIIFTTLGKFTHTLKAFNNGKICQQKTIIITVTECPAAEVLSFSANPTSGYAPLSTTISWVVKNWKTLTLNGEDITGLTNGSGVGSKTFTNIIATTDYVLNVGNDCPSSANDTVTVTILECPKAKILDLHAEPEEVLSGGETTIWWTAENWKTLTLNGVDVSSLTDGNGIGHKTFTNITTETDYVLNAENNCPSTATAKVGVTIKCGDCSLSFVSISPTPKTQTTTTFKDDKDGSSYPSSLTYTIRIYNPKNCPSTAKLNYIFKTDITNTATIDFGIIPAGGYVEKAVTFKRSSSTLLSSTIQCHWYLEVTLKCE